MASPRKFLKIFQQTGSVCLVVRGVIDFNGIDEQFLSFQHIMTEQGFAFGAWHAPCVRGAEHLAALAAGHAQWDFDYFQLGSGEFITAFPVESKRFPSEFKSFSYRSGQCAVFDNHFLEPLAVMCDHFLVQNAEDGLHYGHFVHGKMTYSFFSGAAREHPSM